MAACTHAAAAAGSENYFFDRRTAVVSGGVRSGFLCRLTFFEYVYVFFLSVFFQCFFIVFVACVGDSVGSVNLGCVHARDRCWGGRTRTRLAAASERCSFLFRGPGREHATGTMSSGIPPQRIRLNLSPCAVAAVGTVAAAANNKQSQQPIRAALLRQTSPTQRSCAQQASQSPTIVCWPHDGVKLKSRQSPDQRISPETKALSPGSKGELGLTGFSSAPVPGFERRRRCSS